MNVQFIFRKPAYTGTFSIEYLFGKISEETQKRFDSQHLSLPHTSGGFGLLKNIWHVYRHRSHINHITGDVHYAALGLTGRRDILTIHDLGFMKHPSKVARLIFEWCWIRLPISRVAITTVISEATRQEVLRYVPHLAHKIRVIPDFVSEKYTPVSKIFDAQKPTILIIGVLAPNKNARRVFEALAGISCRVSIVGKLTPEFVQILADHRIEYTNAYNLPEDEMVRKYQEADILVYASLLEGFGMPILEAQNTGIPIVTSNLSSMPEVAGEGACLVDPYSVADIRAGILKVIKDTAYREELVRKGFENAKRYSFEQVFEMYAALYRELGASAR